MNPELQKSLQVTVLSNTLDGYMLMILLIMVATGLLGGLANYYLSERQEGAGPRDWGKYAVLGVIAALTVPLFLNMISSNLLEAARTRPIDFFVFAGFCLIYVVASRRLFENVANRLMGRNDREAQETGQSRPRQEEVPPPAAQTPPEPVAAPEPPAPSPAPPRPEAVRETLSYNDIEILRALAEENYVYGNLAGLTDKTGLGRDMVSARLTILKNMGIIETRISDKNVLHWFVSPKGKQMLDGILSGQDDR